MRHASRGLIRGLTRVATSGLKSGLTSLLIATLVTIPVAILFLPSGATAFVFTAPSASYLCFTHDERPVLELGFSVVFTSAGQLVTQLSTNELQKDGVLRRQTQFSTLSAFQMYDILSSNRLVVGGRSVGQGIERWLELDIELRSGPEVPWPLMGGNVRIGSVWSVEERKVICELADYTP